LSQQKRLANTRLELVQGTVEAAQGIENDQAVLFAGYLGFGQVGQALLVGVFQCATAELVDHQATGDAAEIGAWLFQW